MAVAEPASEETGLDRRAIPGDFARATRRREGPGKRPPPTLGDVIEAIASETENDSELVAVVVHLLDTRKVQWASSPCAAGPDIWFANCSHNGSPAVFD